MRTAELHNRIHMNTESRRKVSITFEQLSQACWKLDESFIRILFTETWYQLCKTSDFQIMKVHFGLLMNLLFLDVYSYRTRIDEWQLIVLSEDEEEVSFSNPSQKKIECISIRQKKKGSSSYQPQRRQLNYSSISKNRC